MQKWILNCLAFKKTIFVLALIVLVVSSFGMRYLILDLKLSLVKDDDFSQQVVFITINDKNLLGKQHLQQIANLHQELSHLKAIKQITNLYTVPNVRRYIDEKEWHSVLDESSYKASFINSVKEDVLDNKLFVGKFIDQHADTMMFYLYIPNDKTGADDLKIRDQIQEILDQHRGEFERIYQTGSAEMTYNLDQKARHDVFVCIPFLFIMMALLFGWLFRNIWLSFLPLLMSIYGIVCALGTMGWCGVPLNSLFIVAIVLTLAVSIAASAHIIYAYQEGQDIQPQGSSRDHFYYMLKKVLYPLLLAVFSALLGFIFDILSFMPVVTDLSYAVLFCVAFNTLATIFVFPLFMPMIKLKSHQGAVFFNFLLRNLVTLNKVLIAHKCKFTVGLLTIGIAGGILATQMTIESLPYVFFNKNDSFIKNMKFSDHHLAGSNVIQVKVFSKEKNVFLTPKNLQAVLDAESHLIKIPNTSYTYSAADVIATTNQIFLFNAKMFFKIPQTPGILTMFYQELSEQGFMDPLMNKEFNELSIFISYTIYSSQSLEAYKKAIETVLNNTLKNTSLQFSVVDFWSRYAVVVDNLILLQIASILTIYLICIVMVGVLFKSFRAGLVSIIPNLIPLCVIAIVQFILGIPVSGISVILYSILVGLSIDETIHMFYTFKDQYSLSKDRHAAVKAALISQTIPVTIASSTIGIACMALLASHLLPLAQLGFLIGVGIFSAWFSDLVITPFLLNNIDVTRGITCKDDA